MGGGGSEARIDGGMTGESTSATVVRKAKGSGSLLSTLPPHLVKQNAFLPGADSLRAV